MEVIHANNVNDAYRHGLSLLNELGEQRGTVVRSPGPITAMYRFPTQRVLWDVQRDANPFLHLFTALWMLNGQNDVDTLARFAGSAAQYSDDGNTLHGAYGDRLRHYNRRSQNVNGSKGFDQLALAVSMLKRNADDRRVTLSMWDPVWDLDNQESKDVPRDVLIKLAIVGGHLDLTVVARCDDIVTGMFGETAVCMSMLQEYLAAMIGVPVGRYWQVSLDCYVYANGDKYQIEHLFPFESEPTDLYAGNAESAGSTDIVSERAVARERLLVDDPTTFDAELRQFMQHVTLNTLHTATLNCKNSFFPVVAQPMYKAFYTHKYQRQTRRAAKMLRDAQPNLLFDIDWLLAGEQWLERAAKRREERVNQSKALNGIVTP